MLNQEDVLDAVNNLLFKLGRQDEYAKGDIPILLERFMSATSKDLPQFLTYAYVFLNRFSQALEEKPWERPEATRMQASNLLTDPDFTSFDEQASKNVDIARAKAAKSFEKVYKKAQEKAASQPPIWRTSEPIPTAEQLLKPFEMNKFIHKLQVMDLHDMNLLLAIIFNTARTAAVPEYGELSLKAVMKSLDSDLLDPKTALAAWRNILFLQGGFFTAIGGNIHVSRDELEILYNKEIVDTEPKNKVLTAEEKDLLRAEREKHTNDVKHAWQMMPIKKLEELANTKVNKNAVYSQNVQVYAGATIQEQAKAELLRRQKQAVISELKKINEDKAKVQPVVAESKPVVATPVATANAAKPARRKSIREILASFFYRQKKKNASAGNISTLSSGSVSINSDTTKPAATVKRRLRKYGTPAPTNGQPNSNASRKPKKTP